MKKITQLSASSLFLLLSACGQKGPLIIDAPTTRVIPVSTSSPATPQTTEVEVLQDEPVLNTQTNEKSTAR